MEKSNEIGVIWSTPGQYFQYSLSSRANCHSICNLQHEGVAYLLSNDQLWKNVIVTTFLSGFSSASYSYWKLKQFQIFKTWFFYPIDLFSKIYLKLNKPIWIRSHVTVYDQAILAAAQINFSYYIKMHWTSNTT